MDWIASRMKFASRIDSKAVKFMSVDLLHVLASTLFVGVWLALSLLIRVMHSDGSSNAADMTDAVAHDWDRPA